MYHFIVTFLPLGVYLTLKGQSRCNAGTEVSQANDSPNLPVQQEKQRTAKMHIVIAHYDSDNLQKTADLWLSILNMDKVKISTELLHPLIEA